MTRPGFDEAVKEVAFVMWHDWLDELGDAGIDPQDVAHAVIEAAYPVILEAAAQEIERVADAEQSRKWAQHWPVGMARAARIVRELAAKDPVKQGETT